MISNRAATSVLLVLLMAPALQAQAQEVRDAERTLLHATHSWLPGDRIRVTTPAPKRNRIEGWYDGVVSDSILQVRLHRSEPPTSIAAHRISLLEEKDGSRRHVLVGMGVGLITGAIVGAAIAASEPPQADAFLDTRKLLPMVTALAGFVVGGGVGYFVKSERWKKVASFETPAP